MGWPAPAATPIVSISIASFVSRPRRHPHRLHLHRLETKELFHLPPPTATPIASISIVSFIAHTRRHPHRLHLYRLFHLPKKP